MSVATVVIPVPASGDGLAVSVAALLGSKTVVLTGQFEGTYVLLASHDGVTYVPAMTFNSGGPEGVQATLDDAYNFVRLRSSATPHRDRDRVGDRRHLGWDELLRRAANRRARRLRAAGCRRHVGALPADGARSGA